MSEEMAPDEAPSGEIVATEATGGGGANEFPEALPEAKPKSLEELKDEAGAWTLASDESVAPPETLSHPGLPLVIAAVHH